MIKVFLLFVVLTDAEGLGFKAFINYDKMDALKVMFDFIDLLSDLM